MKTKWIVTFIVVVIILLLVALFWNKIFPPKDETIEQQEAKEEAQSNGNQTTQPALEAGTFPLQVKDKNQKVQSMQAALIKLGCSISAGATGYFGSQTQAALKCAGYDENKVTEADYNQILAGKNKVLVIKPGDSLVANKNVVQLYDEGLNKTVTKNQGQFIGTAVSVNTTTNIVKFKESSSAKFGYVYLNDVKVA